MLDKIIQFFEWAKGVYEGSKVLQAITTIVNVATLVVGVKGFIQARNMLAKGQDILANKTSAGGKIPVIYGTRRVGAQIIYMDVNANDSRDLYVVYALAVGEVDEIIGNSIELDGNRLTDSARFRDGGYIGTDKISSGNYSLNTVSQNGTGIDAGAGQFGSSPTSKYRYVMNLHHGAATQTADPMLVASMPNWTSAHKLNGIAYIAAHYGYDKEGIWSGVPQLTVQVRGKKVYDPRDSGQTFGTVSTYEYSSNPALCFLDFITNNEYGKGLTESQINMSTFSSAANVCDTEVDNPFFGGTSKSLTWSGVAGDGFITIGGSDPNSDWWQNKIGELIDIYDNNGDGVITGKEITDIQRDEFFDQNPLYRVYFNDTLGTNYSSQSTGSSLVKIKRFHCNGYLDTNKNVMDNAKELLANMRGIFLYIDGKYELQIEDTGSSSFTITDDHIISDAGISVDYGNKDKKANKVIVEFFNANKRYELDTATAFHDATPEYYSDDNDEILEIKAEFPYVTDPYIAYNMAKAILVRSRKQMTIQFLGTPEMYKLNVGDIVTLNYVGTFDTSQTCRVEALELQPNGLVAVSLIEYFDVYTWQSPSEEPLEELANLPSAYAVKAPTNITFTDSSSSSTGRPILSWDAPTDYPDYEFRVNVVDDSGNQLMNRIVNTTFAELNFTPTGSNYVASITSLNTLGTESDPETETFSVSDEPVGLGDIRADAVTANTIDVNELSAISADMGSITAGSIDIGSGNFTVSSAGVLDATGATINGEFVAGSGSNIFTADADGIYLGNATFADAPFKVLSSGEVQTTKSFTAGVAGTDEIAKMSGTGDYRFWSGSETPSNASFSVDKDGKAIAKNLVLKLTDGTVYFDSETGFSSSAISQISTSTGTKVSTVSSTFDADTEYEEITVTSTTSVNVDVSIDANFGGAYGNATLNTAIDESEQKVPENFTLTIEHSSDGGSTYNTVVTDTFTRVNDRLNPKTTPLSDEYKINTSIQEIFISGGGGVIYLATTTTSLNLGCVDSDGRTTLSYTGLSLSGTTAGTTHRIRASVSTTDTNYDTTNNNVSSTTPRVLSVTDPSGDGFYVDNGSGSTVPPEGDITAVQITTASSSGLTGGANFTSGDASFTLALASSIDGAKTFTNNVVIQGDLDVQGTTTTIDTTNLDVKDKNITLNYGTGDTSANANGAGITIQDAVNSTTDATLTWNTSDDSFNFSHDVNVTGTIDSGAITADGLTVNGAATINGTTPLLYLTESDTTNLNSRIRNTVGNLQIHTANDAQNSFTARVNISHSTGDISFYEDTGTTAKFFWDASAESLGIGTTSPASKLHIIGETRVEQTGAASRLVINRYDVNAADSSTIDLLESSSQGASFGTTGVFGYRLELDGNTNNLNIKSGNQSTVNTRLSIERDTGNIGIGTSSPDGKLDIASAQNTTNQFTSPHLALTATSTTNTTGFTGISYASSTLTNYGWTVGALRDTTGNNSDFVFNLHNNSASGSEKMRIGSTAVDVNVFLDLNDNYITGVNGYRNVAGNEIIDSDNVSYTIVRSYAGVSRLWLGETSTYANNNNFFFRDTGSNHLVTINSTGLDIRSGGLDINSLEVIDSSRNLTNIGTISSGQLNVNAGATNTTAVFESTDDKAFIRIKDDDTDTYLISKDGNFSIGGSSEDYDNFKVDISSGNTVASGGTHTFGSSSNTTTTVNITATNTAGSPAEATKLVFNGYESRSQGLHFTDSGLSGERWFAGIPYSGLFNSFQIGYDQTGDQAEYAANSVFRITDGGYAGIGIGNSSPSHPLHVKHATTNVVARFESGDTDVWIDLHDSNSGTYGALLGHSSTELFKVADANVATKLSLSNAGDLTIQGELDASGDVTTTGINIGTDSGDSFNGKSVIRIQDGGNAYIQIKAGTSEVGGILIGDVDDDFVGGMLYSNSTNALTFNSGNVLALTLDSSQNATFAGTISSGAITSSGLVTSVGGVVNTNTGSNAFYVTRSGATNQALKIYVDDAAAIFESIQDESLDNYGTFIFAMDGGTTEPFFDVRKGTAASGSKFRVDGSGALQVGSANTTFLDASRNLTNIGTISSGSITATDSYGGGSGDFTNITTPQLKIVAEGSGYWRIPHLSGNSTISGVYNYEDTKDVYWGEPSDTGLYRFRGRNLRIEGGSLQIGSTTVIDSDRNLDNINSLDVTSTTSDLNKFTFTDTNSNATFTGLTLDYNASGSQAHTTDRTHRALFVDFDTSQTGGNTTDENRAYGIHVDVRGAGDTDLRYGIYSYSETQHSSGTVSSNIALYGIAIADDTGTGRTANNIGVQGLAYGYNTGTGGSTNHYAGNFKTLLTTANDKNTNTAHGVYAEVEIDNPGQAQTVTNTYGVRSIIDNDSAGNVTITNAYLFHGDYQGTIPSGGYGIYINENVPNLFGGSVEADSFIKDGGTDAQFLKADGSVQSSSASSPQGTTSPFNASANTLTFLINVAHLDGLVTGSQTGVLDLSTGELEINSQGEINIKANSIEASKIQANTITGDEINTDLLNVKSFDNVSSTIKSHVTAGTKFPLARDGQAYVQRTGTYTGSNGSFVPVTITQVRDNAGYVAIFSGVLGDVSGGRVQYSLNNSTWVNANGNTNIYWNAGTYRGYTYVYTGQITTLSTSQSTVYWRVYFSGSYNHTQLSLNVMMDNTR